MLFFHIIINKYIFASYVSGCALASTCFQMTSCHPPILAYAGMTPDSVSYTVLISSLCLLGCIDDALQAFSRLQVCCI